MSNAKNMRRCKECDNQFKYCFYKYGISIKEAYEHPTVKAHKDALNHLTECYNFANGNLKR